MDRQPAASGGSDRRRRAVRRSLRDHVDAGFRADIEGLRALAVIAVVAFHAEVPGLDGGFVGVDVFFVVSGFLITRLILGELASHGCLSLRSFWARRARRLLPASVLTVVVTVIVGQRLLPPLALHDLSVDAVAAGTFTANFVFAHRLGDYFAAQLGSNSPSPLLHYWSLALEEQFYLCWPPLLVWLTRRPRQYRRLVLSVTVGLVVVGFGLGWWWSHRQPSWAFFLLPARMGELLAGAGLAIIGTGLARVPVPWRRAAGWLGVIGIVVSCFVISERLPWPGVAVLLPVASTAAVIIGGYGPGRPAGVGALLAASPLQWIGRHSYAIYLWHWPALVLAAVAWGPLTAAERLLIVALSVGVAAASVRLVEDPIRHSRSLSARPGRSLALGAVLSLVAVGVGWDLRSSVGPLDGGVEAAAPQLAPVQEGAVAATTTSTIAAPGSTTTTAAADVAAVDSTTTTLATPDPPSGQLGQMVAATQRTLGQSLGAFAVPSNLDPSLASARDRSQPYADGCVNVGTNYNLQPCEYGTPGATRTILLYGDSHAAQWFEPLEQLALERGYRLVVLLKAGCPVAAVDVPTPVLRYTCPPYRDRVINWIVKNEPALVVAGNSYTQYPADAEEWGAGTDETVGRLADAANAVVLVGDNPFSLVDPPACLSEHLDDVSPCVTDRVDAVLPERISAEVTAAREHGITFVDTTDWFCTDAGCPVIVGNVLVMRDETHITVPMAMFLQPVLAAAVSPALT